MREIFTPWSAKTQQISRIRVGTAYASELFKPVGNRLIVGKTKYRE